jgi:hypothetical protein
MADLPLAQCRFGPSGRLTTSQQLADEGVSAATPMCSRLLCTSPWSAGSRSVRGEHISIPDPPVVSSRSPEGFRRSTTAEQRLSGEVNAAAPNRLRIHHTTCVELSRHLVRCEHHSVLNRPAAAAMSPNGFQPADHFDAAARQASERSCTQVVAHPPRDPYACCWPIGVRCAHPYAEPTYRWATIGQRPQPAERSNAADRTASERSCYHVFAQLQHDPGGPSGPLGSKCAHQYWVSTCRWPIVSSPLCSS